MSMPPKSRDPGDVDLRAWRMDPDVQLLSLDAQLAMLPYALGFFAVGLPIFVWVASYADNAVWALASLSIFAINWAAFYGLVAALKRDAALASDIGRRTRLGIIAGLLWSGAVIQISILALGAGPAKESLLMAATGSAVVLIVFSAPSLAAMLIVGPVAAAGPLVAFFIDPEGQKNSQLALAAVALSAALSLVLNRMLVRQFALSCERQKLVEAHAHTRTEAERLAKSKSDLLATLSHEIRTGLTGVVHVLEAAAGSGGRAAPSREQLGAALEAARDLSSALDATLDSEQAEAGRLTVRMAPFDPVRLASDLVLLNRPQAAAKGLEMSLHVEPELEAPQSGAAIGDASRARQVLSQLIANAVRYTLRGRVEIRLRRLSPRRIRFEVADTGPGLGPDELAQAFTPFARIERTSAGSSGAGVGLALARKLALLMQGEVSAESALGVGSCFFMDLAYDPAACLADGPPAEAPGEGPLRVLMVEAETLQAAMLRACLEQLGHQVLHAQRASRVADLLRLCEVDLAVIGDGGPDASTVEVVEALRGAIATSLPVVAVIEGQADEAARCRAAGADEVVRRPVTVAGLARAISTLRPGQAQSAAA